MRVRNLLKYLILFWLVIILADQTQFFMATDYFKIMSIESEGDYSLVKRDIIDRIKALKGINIWYLDTKTIEEEIKKDVRIKNITLTKIFPDKLKLVIEERTPFVYTIKNKNIVIADENGIIYAYREEVNAGRRIMVEAKDSKELKSLIKVADNVAGNFEKVSSTLYIDAESIKILLNDGFIVKTALDTEKKKYEIGYKLYLKLREEWKAGKPHNEYMDLRFKDYIVK